MSTEQLESEQILSLNNNLLDACSNNNIDAARIALLEGADQNAKNTYGVPALMLVSYMGNKDIVELLLEKGVCLGSINKALVWAELEEHMDIVKLLEQSSFIVSNQTQASRATDDHDMQP